MFYFILILCLYTQIIQASFQDEKECAKRVQAHLLIGDFTVAIAEAQAGIDSFPQSKILLEEIVRAAAKKRDEKQMLQYWGRLIANFPEEKENRELLECLAWSVIENGFYSSSPLVRLTALLGAFFSRDAKGVALLRQGLKDEHAFLRAAAVKLSAILSDSSLQEEVLHLFRCDKSWEVRLETIQAIGKMRLFEAKEGLIQIISDPNAHAEEQAAAIEAVVLMYQAISREQLTKLVNSKRMGMRLLACECVAVFDQMNDADLLLPLLSDTNSKVRAKLFQTLGRIRCASLAGYSVIDCALKGVDDPHPEVAISAAWLLIIHQSKLGERALERWLSHSHPQLRCLAAAAIAASGKYGISLALRYFNVHQDLYVRMNLCVGLIRQRIQAGPAAEGLYQSLLANQERMEWLETGFFRVLSPSKVKHNQAIPNYPEAVNQLTRLEIMQMLCLLEHPDAQQALKHFLKERRWEISGFASILLLTEGDDSAIEKIKHLLDDPDPTVRIQSALVIALWGREEEVVQLLQKYFKEADRELKGQILEALGRIGSPVSFLFLAEQLQEPRQSLRIVAAAALLECLYH